MLDKLSPRLILIWIALLANAWSVPVLGQSNNDFGAQGRAKFRAQKYDEAIELLTKHVRKHIRDYDAWNVLGAAFYHTGQPRKALRYLKFVEKKNIEKSYNYYYQGLCYIAGGDRDKSRDYWVFAASRYSDDYAARATFEVAFLEYQDRNGPKADYWLSRYLQLYPRGPYAAAATKLLQSVRTNTWISSPEPPKRPEIEKALFKYSKLSLSKTPHFWFFQTGWRGVNTTGNDPDGFNGGMKPSSVMEQAAVVNAAIGFGPIKEGSGTIYGGYTYRQLWFTDNDRVEEFMSSWDGTYFPFRADLLQRKHQLYADFREDLSNSLYLGFFTRLEFSRMGSSFFPTPEDEQLRQVIPMSQTQMVIPWIGATYAENMRGLVYFYFRKEINDDTPEFSNKTYDLGIPALSFGTSHEWEIPQYQLTLGAEVFQYEFIYNDPWLDYKRLGVFLSLEHEFIPRWYVNLLFGIYNDTYIQTRYSNTGCSDSPRAAPAAGAANNQDVKSCPRFDDGLMIQGMVYWNWTQYQRFSGHFLHVQNKNNKQKIFDQSRQVFQLTYTLAFPSVKRVARFVDRFADTAFTKEAE